MSLRCPGCRVISATRSASATSLARTTRAPGQSSSRRPIWPLRKPCAEYRTHSIRGLALADLGESAPAAAEARAREAAEVAIGADRMHEGEALVVLARARLALGRPEAAIEAAEQALAIQQTTGYFLGLARAHQVLGLAKADPAHLQEAQRMFDAFGSPEAA